MWVTIARVLLRNRQAFLIGLAVLVAFMVYQAQFVQMGYGFARMIPDTDSVAIENVKFENTFGQAGNTVVIIMEDPDFFTVDHLSSWRNYLDSLHDIDGVSSVFSIANAYDLEADEDSSKLRLIPLLDDQPKSEEEVEAFKNRALDLPFYKDLLYTDDGEVQVLLVRIDEEKLYNKNIIPIVESIKAVNASFEARTGLDLHTSGLPYLRMANVKKLKFELYFLIFLTILVTTILLYAFLRSFRATLISLLVVALGVVFSFGLLGTFHFEISILSSLIPPLVIVIGVPNCIYLINKYHQEFRLHQNKIKALQRVIRRIGTVTVLTNFTTALGFATFILTDSDALVEFGIVASLNIFLVFLLSIVLIPIIYSYLKPPKERHYKHFDLRWLQGMLNFLNSAVTNHRTAVYISMFTVLGLGIMGIFNLRVTGNLTDDFEKDDPLYVDIQYIEEKFEGVMPLEIVVDTKRKNGVTKLKTLNKIDEFQQRISEKPQISRSLSLVDFVKFAHQGILFGNPDMYALPTRNERQWMMKYLPKGEDENSLFGYLVDSTGQKARISMQMADLGTTEMRELQTEIRALADEIFERDKYDITITGASVVFIRTTDYLIKNLIVSMALAFIIISIIMAILFGSGKMVFISIVPNVIPLILTAGLMGYLDIPLKPSTILVFSIAFGISIDDTIHFLARYRQELRSNGWRIGEAVKTAIQETGVSMFYTSIILFFGFSVFIMSSFGGTQALGLLVALTLIFAMLTNLIILPTFLMSLDKRIRAKDFNSGFIDIYAEEDEDELEDQFKTHPEEKTS